ncbi:hypothetical protein [uncultured Gammaproteobacteria bacterium]|nr:hypothetical protein [uncultured Gammaproteobacteria bacterium]CAC9958746.1 hypothetical protein [uncultured Gammaproteobacteria bacterium]
MSETVTANEYVKLFFTRLKSFLSVYFLYLLSALVISNIILFLIFSFFDLFFNTSFFTIYNEFSKILNNPNNSSKLFYLINLSIVVIASISFVVWEHLSRLNLKIDHLKISTQTIQNLINNNNNSSKLEIINYQQLIQVEKEHACSEIYIITNDLSDDLNDEHFFNTIIDNIVAGKKYKFIIPDIDTNRIDGCSFLGKLIKELKKLKITKQSKNIVDYCEVYLVLDQLFRICAFRDIAIYGSELNLHSRVGYVEIPYIEKKDDPGNRFFIKFNDKICSQMTSDIKIILEKSEYVEALSCSIKTTIET